MLMTWRASTDITADNFMDWSSGCLVKVRERPEEKQTMLTLLEKQSVIYFCLKPQSVRNLSQS